MIFSTDIKLGESLVMLDARKRTAALRTAMRAMIAHWHVSFIDFHFREAAYDRYPDTYKRRIVKSRHPYRRKQEERPLYHTGLTRQMAMGTAKFYARANEQTPTMTATASFQVPGYLYYMRRHGYNPSAELSAMNQSEWTEMMAEFRKVLQEELTANDGEVRTHYIRI